MNELFAADPAVCGNANDLKLLFSSFGPYAGRYLANYPTDWAMRIEQQFGHLGDIEAARVQTLLRRAKENLTLVTRLNLSWKTDRDWLANASPLLGSELGVFDGIIAKDAKPPTIQQLHDLELPPTAEERIAGSASEYVRISGILLLHSPEIALIDPYLNPLKRACAAVLDSLFGLVAKGKGKCKKVFLWVRASEVLGSGNPVAIKADMHDAIRRLANPGCEIEMILVENETRKTKMHGRYLLSIKGGIRLDQGFQRLPDGRYVDVGPVGKAIHNELLDIFFDGKHDMQVVERITFNR